MDIHEDEVEDGEERRKEEEGEETREKNKQACVCALFLSKKKNVLTDGE